jgi:hypothetical protein
VGLLAQLLLEALNTSMRAELLLISEIQASARHQLSNTTATAFNYICRTGERNQLVPDGSGMRAWDRK